MRKSIFWIILIIFIYTGVESFSYGGLFFLKKYRHINYVPIDDVLSNNHRKILTKFLKGKTNYIEFSSLLGWTIKKNGASKIYQANSHGIRSSREYELTPPDDVLRIATFGDSFTNCTDVNNEETWQASLEKIALNLEVLNFGVGGYGLDQAYLRYLEMGLQHKPHIVFIGYLSKDIFRHVNTFRPFYFPDTSLPLTKPRFIIDNEELSLIPNPMDSLVDYNMLLLQPKETLAKIGENDFFYAKGYKSSKFDFSPTVRFFKLAVNNFSNSSTKSIVEASEAFELTMKIFDKFHASVSNNNALPIIVIFSDIADLTSYQYSKTKSYSSLIAYFDSKGYQYIDLMEIFDKTGKDYKLKKLFVNGHYSPFTNTLVAKHIQSYLLNNNLLHR